MSKFKSILLGASLCFFVGCSGAELGITDGDFEPSVFAPLTEAQTVRAKAAFLALNMVNRTVMAIGNTKRQAGLLQGMFNAQDYLDACEVVLEGASLSYFDDNAQASMTMRGENCPVSHSHSLRIQDMKRTDRVEFSTKAGMNSTLHPHLQKVEWDVHVKQIDSTRRFDLSTGTLTLPSGEEVKLTHKRRIRAMFKQDHKALLEFVDFKVELIVTLNAETAADIANVSAHRSYVNGTEGSWQGSVSDGGMSDVEPWMAGAFLAGSAN